jgi:hypothetical protein
MLPASVRESLTRHLADVQRLHARDLARGFGRVVLPFALDRKFPECTGRMALVVPVSSDADLPRSTIRAAVAVPPA